MFFSFIVLQIIGQMLSNKVVVVILKRFIELVGNIDPEHIISAGTEEIRKCGISYSKIKYIKNLTTIVKNNEISLSNLHEFSDE